MMGTKSFIYHFGDFEFRERQFSLVKAGEAVDIEHKAFRALLFLLRNPKTLVPKEELVNAVWGDVAVADGSLTRCIWHLRRVLGDDFNEPRYIETVAKVGYRLICDVVVIEEVQPVPGLPSDPTPVLPVPSVPPKWKRLLEWLIPVTAVLVVVLAAAAFWYLHRPLPPLKVTRTDPITHDNHGGWIAGTDGVGVYFNYDASSSAVYMVSVSGGDIQKVPLGVGHVWLWDVSPDGSNLLVRALEPSALWTVSVPGGPAHFITKVDNTWSQSFSPDGKYIAYSDERKGQEGLYVMRRDGADVRKLVTLKATDDPYDIAWSPDGGRIRFTDHETATDHHSLWEISSTGANLHPVFPKWRDPAGQCCGQWTADGDFYLFIAGVPGSAQIWTLDERHRFLSPASPDPIPLTSGPIHWVTPTPSKDGNKIFATGTMPRGELVRFDRISKQLRPFLGGISAEFLAYSKDGAQIAYVTYPDGILWRAKADGTERIQLTNPPLYPLLCRWSPDGLQILFTAKSNNTGTRTVLYVIPAQGGSPRLLVPADDGEGQGEGVWSPDGRRVLYSTSAKDSLRILDLDSGKVSQVSGSNGLFSPRWSPDGRYFAAMSRSVTDAGFNNVTDAIRIFDLQSQQWSTLVEHRGNWDSPTWSHDSKFLYALNDAVPPSVYRIAVPGGTPQRVVDLKDFRFTGAIGGWISLDPDDTPILLRDNGSNDIYALTLDSK